jgi:glutathione S-transferase
MTSQTSPFGRKVLACAIAREIDSQLELLPTNPHESPASLVAANPLSKIPCLITSDGVALFDSPVICEYLDTVGDALPLFPRAGSAARWQAIKLQAIADGMLDAGVLRRSEQVQRQDGRRAGQVARMKAAVDRSLDLLEADPPGPAVDIGSLSIAVALGYLDFRYAAEPWRSLRPRLAAWFETMEKLPALARTIPRDPA